MSNQIQPVLELSFGPLKVVWFSDGAKDDRYSFHCEKWLSGAWTVLPESTYKTLLPVDTEREILLAASHRILEVLETKGVGYFDAKVKYYKDDLALLSWMSLDTFNMRYTLESVI